MLLSVDITKDSLSEILKEFFSRDGWISCHFSLSPSDPGNCDPQIESLELKMYPSDRDSLEQIKQTFGALATQYRREPLILSGEAMNEDGSAVLRLHGQNHRLNISKKVLTGHDEEAIFVQNLPEKDTTAFLSALGSLNEQFFKLIEASSGR